MVAVAKSVFVMETILSRAAVFEGNCEVCNKPELWLFVSPRLCSEASQLFVLQE